MKVYVSGALTGVSEDLKKFYEDIGKICSDLEVEAYVPHLHTDPVQHPLLTPRSVFLTDKQKVLESDLIICYAGERSLGVGIELGIAEMYEIPVILLYEIDADVSRMARGLPNVFCELKFETLSGALIPLKGMLIGYVQQRNMEKEVTQRS